MTRTTIATALNFFFPGAGYLALGIKQLRAVLFLVGVIVLTYVETTLKGIDLQLYWTMFGAVLVMNTGFAIDAWIEGRRLAAERLSVAA